MYPSAANPTSPPNVTIVDGSVYNIDVFDSVPSSSNLMGGASSIIVRACDVLNESPNSCSDFFLVSRITVILDEYRKFFHAYIF